MGKFLTVMQISFESFVLPLKTIDLYHTDNLHVSTQHTLTSTIFIHYFPHAGDPDHQQTPLFLYSMKRPVSSTMGIKLGLLNQFGSHFSAG